MTVAKQEAMRLYSMAMSAFSHLKHANAAVERLVAYEPLETLAINLAIGAALCLAFELGGAHGNCFPDMCTGFRPGCGRSAP